MTISTKSSTRTASTASGPPDGRHLDVWLWILATIALIATATAVG